MSNEADTTVERALASEQSAMGRPISLVDHAHLTDDTLCIVYDQAPSDLMAGLGRMHTRRVAVYVNGAQKWSGIISTTWA